MTKGKDKASVERTIKITKKESSGVLSGRDRRKQRKNPLLSYCQTDSPRRKELQYYYLNPCLRNRPRPLVIIFTGLDFRLQTPDMHFPIEEST